MSLNYLENVYNGKDKRKGTITSVVLHLLLLLLALYPMLTKVEAQDETFPKPMLIQFSSLAGGGEGSSGGSSGSEGLSTADDFTESEPTEAPVEAISEPTPVTPVETPIASPVETRPVRTTIPSAENIALPTNKNTKVDNSKSNQPVKLNQSKFSKPVPADFDLLPPRDESTGSGFGSGKGTGSGSGNSTGSGSGSGSGTGTGDGTGNASGKGSGTGVGDGSGAGTGKGPSSIFEGIGDLKRKIVYRPNLKVLAVEEGVIAYDVCVTREGRVTQVVFDRKNSTIKDKETIQKTLDVANQYRFEPSPTGAALECGKLRLRITINL